MAVLAEGRLIALGEPQELRRDVLGGDVIEIETTRAIDAASLAGLTDIKEVRQPGPRRILVIVEDAGAATPGLLEALRDQGAADQVAERARPELVLGRRHGLVDDERGGQSAQPDRPSDAPSRQRKMSSGASLMRRRPPGVARAYVGVVGSRTYFPLWVGQLGSSFGDMPHHIAVVVPVFQLT